MSSFLHLIAFLCPKICLKWIKYVHPGTEIISKSDWVCWTPPSTQLVSLLSLLPPRLSAPASNHTLTNTRVQTLNTFINSIWFSFFSPLFLVETLFSSSFLGRLLWVEWTLWSGEGVKEWPWVGRKAPDRKPHTLSLCSPHFSVWNALDWTLLILTHTHSVIGRWEFPPDQLWN